MILTTEQFTDMLIKTFVIHQDVTTSPKQEDEQCR